MNLKNKKLIIFSLVALMLVTLIAVTPLIWTIKVKNRIANQIKSSHGDNYAVIGLNVNHDDARDTFHLSMYERLYSYVRFKCGYYPFYNAWHHCAVLVSDNEKIYRYYWSIRENALVLDQSKAIPDAYKSTYRYENSEIVYKHNIRFKANVSDRDIYWYF